MTFAMGAYITIFMVILLLEVALTFNARSVHSLSVSRFEPVMREIMPLHVHNNLDFPLKHNRGSCHVTLLVGPKPPQVHKSVVFNNFAKEKFILREEMDGDCYLSIVEFEESGEVTFLETSREDAKKISGAWSVEKNTMHMAIERTHSGRFAEYTVESRFVGQVGQVCEAHSSRQIMGEICFESLTEYDVFSTGKFSLESIGNSRSVGSKFLRGHSSRMHTFSSV